MIGGDAKCGVVQLARQSSQLPFAQRRTWCSARVARRGCNVARTCQALYASCTCPPNTTTILSGLTRMALQAAHPHRSAHLHEVERRRLCADFGIEKAVACVAPPIQGAVLSNERRHPVLATTLPCSCIGTLLGAAGGQTAGIGISMCGRRESLHLCGLAAVRIALCVLRLSL